MHPGFGLLEVLVALALIAVTLLGLLNGLLNTELQAIDNMARVDAALQSENIYEQMRVNRVGVKEGAYYQAPGISPTCNPCDPHQQAAKDLYTWQQQIADELTSGEGEVSAYGSGQQILIRWQALLTQDTQVNEWVLYGNN